MLRRLAQASIPTVLDWVGPLLLCKREVMRIPKGISGVYLLHAFAPDVGGYPVFYVGQSHDLRRRLLAHLGDGSAKPAVRAVRELERAYFSAAPVMFGELLDRVEAGLILMLRPICNAQEPATDPVLVSLPPITVVH